MVYSDAVGIGCFAHYLDVVQQFADFQSGFTQIIRFNYSAVDDEQIGLSNAILVLRR